MLNREKSGFLSYIRHDARVPRQYDVPSLTTMKLSKVLGALRPPIFDDVDSRPDMIGVD